MRSIVLLVAGLSLLCVACARAEFPTTQPLTLQPQLHDPEIEKLYSTMREQQMDKLLEQREKLQQRLDALSKSRSFDITICPVPAGQKPQGEVEHWAGASRPALMHITPNVVETGPGHYMVHQDRPRIVVNETMDSLQDPARTYIRARSHQDLDLIDDRPQPQK